MTTHSSQHSGILIVGGYGAVGRRVAAHLAPLYPGEVIIAGRNLEAAERTARSIGRGCHARALDLSQSVADKNLVDIDLVLVCIDQVDTHFVRQCLTAGIHYLDITAGLGWLERLSDHHDLALRHQAITLLSLGTTPGLTNLLGADMVRATGSPQRLDLLVEFGTGERHGDAALNWMFDQLDARFQVRESGQWLPARSFGERRRFIVSGGRSVSGYRFNLPDQQILANTLDLPSVATWVRFSSATMTGLVALAVRLGLGRALRNPRIRRVARTLFSRLAFGTDHCTLAALLTDADGARHWARLSARKESRLTAAVAAAAVWRIKNHSMTPGVHHLHQVLTLDDLLPMLRRWLPELTLQQGSVKEPEE